MFFVSFSKYFKLLFCMDKTIIDASSHISQQLSCDIVAFTDKYLSAMNSYHRHKINSNFTKNKCTVLKYILRFERDNNQIIRAKCVTKKYFFQKVNTNIQKKIRKKNENPIYITEKSVTVINWFYLITFVYVLSFISSFISHLNIDVEKCPLCFIYLLRPQEKVVMASKQREEKITLHINIYIRNIM